MANVWHLKVSSSAATCSVEILTVTVSFATGVLVDTTQQYFYVFIACSAVVASSALFLILSFLWLDKKERKGSQQGQLSAQPEAEKPAADAPPVCEYSDRP